MRWARLTGVVALVAALAPSLARAGRADENVILDERAYWRCWLHGGALRIDYEAMKADGQKVLDKRSFERLRQTVLRKLKAEGRATDDWRKEVHYPGRYLNLRLLNEVTTTPPPATWMQASFDDGDWSCYRKPFKMGKDFHLDGYVDHFFQIKTTCFRTAFEVPDPAKAGSLRLRLVYRGGVRAFLNGRQIARGHLPAGTLADDTPAQPYPAEAYYARGGEHSPLTGGRAVPWTVLGDGVLVPETGVFASRPEAYDRLRKSDRVPGPYRRARALGYGGRCYLTRAAWERVVGVRDRKLEVAIPAGRLRAGDNVLAIEVRTSQPHPIALRWSIPWQGSCTWKHGWLLKVELRGRGVPSATVPRQAGGPKPAALDGWVVDVHHRLYSPEFRPSMRTDDLSRRNLRSGFLRGSGSTFYQRLNRPNMASEAAAAYSPGVGSTAQMGE